MSAPVSADVPSPLILQTHPSAPISSGRDLRISCIHLQGSSGAAPHLSANNRMEIYQWKYLFCISYAPARHEYIPYQAVVSFHSSSGNIYLFSRFAKNTGRNLLLSETPGRTVHNRRGKSLRLHHHPME